MVLIMHLSLRASDEPTTQPSPSVVVVFASRAVSLDEVRQHLDDLGVAADVPLTSSVLFAGTLPLQQSGYDLAIESGGTCHAGNGWQVYERPGSDEAKRRIRDGSKLFRD